MIGLDSFRCTPIVPPPKINEIRIDVHPAHLKMPAPRGQRHLTEAVAGCDEFLRVHLPEVSSPEGQGASMEGDSGSV